MPGVPVAGIHRLKPSQISLRPKTPSDQQFHNDSRFDSNMAMTAWVFFVGNVSTACIAHPEGTRISA